MVLTGDVTQSDLQSHRQGGFNHLIDILHDINQVSMVHLDGADILRNPIISSIIHRIESVEQEEKE